MVKTPLPFKRSVVLASQPLSTLLVLSTSQNPAGGETLTVVFPTFASRDWAADEIKQAMIKISRRIKILPKIPKKPFRLGTNKPAAGGDPINGINYIN
jgi:hypothetical protein